MAKRKRPQPTDDPAGWYRDPILWAITALAALLLLANLGGRCLWQDEAETALLGRNIVHFGKPVATDGVNVVSQEAGRDFDANHIWRWSPWAQFYLAAAGLKISDSTLGARLPFALLAILVIPLTYLLARRIYESILIARFAALALTASVWFLLHARQSRWHAPAYVLACLILIAVFEKRPWLLAFSGAALFYTNYFVAICFLVAVAVASPLIGLNRRLIAGLAGAAALSIPGVIYFDVLGKSGGHASPWTQFWTYLVQFLVFLAPLPLVLVATSDRRPATRFFFAMTLAMCVMLAFAPWAMFRYLTILFPVAALLTGVALAWLMRKNAIVGWIAVALLVFTSVLHRLPLGYMNLESAKVFDDTPVPLIAYAGELISPPKEPECVVAGYLRAHATPDETVLATYGDLALQFYTRMHVIGGMQGQPLPSDPDWIIGRSFIRSYEPGKDFTVRRWVNTQIDISRYTMVAMPPDPCLPGSPDPMFHSFHDTPKAEPMRILHRTR
ncbi:MAG TPA: hypothetical protein VJ901_03295 [Thermoanaerobaculia bacterium]|nr:hypothetical protein [Thermoanaerobaculia bacterium]